MEYVIMISQLFLSLSILIVLHELGHFVPARLFNTRVEKFYLFFDPWFELFKFKKGDTEYGIGWLPLGGYVKIAGMIDESMDREQMALPPQPWEFRSKPAWQRLIIMLGGVTVNFILGFFLYGMVLWTWGESYMPAANVSYGIYADSLGLDMGLKDGDKILSINEVPFKKFDQRLLLQEIIFNNARSLKVIRNDREVTIPIDEKWVGELTSYKNKDNRLFGPRTPFEVNSIQDDDKFPAKKAGFKIGDRVIALNETSTPFYSDFAKLARNYKGKTITITSLRAQDTIKKTLTLTPEGKMGVFAQPPEFFFKTARQEYSFLEALPAGTAKGWNFLSQQVKAFGQMFRGKIKATESLGGFGSIGKMFGSIWHWERFWTMTALLSLILAFMNLLPIPALDGGHVMFLLYEIVTGRKPSDQFMEYATIAGFVIVLGLVVLANGLDFLRWLNG